MFPVSFQGLRFLGRKCNRLLISMDILNDCLRLVLGFAGTLLNDVNGLRTELKGFNWLHRSINDTE